ncbi:MULTISPECIES: StaA [Pseudomonas]|nr:StaA [Pseudomonas saponiphila]
MLGEIEAALTAGASREDVWETLKNEHGMTIGFNGFCKALMRARAARQERAGTPAATTPPLPRPGNDGQGKEVDCAIQNEEPTPPEAPLKGRIVTSSDFEKVHSMDFSDLDDKYTGKRK